MRFLKAWCQTNLLYNQIIGVWRSWLARTAGGREVVGSSPITPTKQRVALRAAFCLELEWQDLKLRPIGVVVRRTNTFSLLGRRAFGCQWQANVAEEQNESFGSSPITPTKQRVALRAAFCLELEWRDLKLRPIGTRRQQRFMLSFKPNVYSAASECQRAQKVVYAISRPIAAHKKIILLKFEFTASFSTKNKLDY